MADETLRVGNVELLALSDADGPLPFTLDQVFPTTPMEAWEPYRQRFPQCFAEGGRWHAHIGSYLLRSGGRTVLVDTGFGWRPIEMLGGLRGSLLDDFKRHGVSPADVDVVFHTHLHFDHVGWNIGEDGRPTFPRARYVAHQADWETFNRPEVQENFPPYVAQTLTPLKDLGLLDLLTGEQALAEGVVALPTPGHTPGHMSVLVSSGGEQALILGDTIVNPAQVTDPEITFGFDMDAATATATRKQVLDRLQAEGMVMAGGHLPRPGYGRIVLLEGKRYWQAL
jgi:glyoxylase-like metal-dependent hydrolase (beta-lactamase superfamily II)